MIFFNIISKILLISFEELLPAKGKKDTFGDEKVAIVLNVLRVM